jgi:hypothetical protein
MSNSSQLKDTLASEWKVEGVTAWIQITFTQYSKYGLPKIFEANDISGEKLLQLTEQDLINMKIESLGVRKDILKSITALKKGICLVYNIIETDLRKPPEIPTIQSPSGLQNPTYPFPAFQRFQDRDFQVIVHLAKKNYELHSYSTTPTRQNVAFLTIFGGAGIGKTRTALQIGKYLRKHVPNFESCLEIYVDFGNGDRILESEKFGQATHILGIRVCVHCFFNCTLRAALDRKLIDEDKIGTVPLTDVIQFLRDSLISINFIKKDDILPIVVILDEYQMVKKWRTDWGDIAACLMETTQIESQNKKLVIVPVVVGTILPVDQFSLSSFMQIKFRLEPLTLIQIQNLLKQEIDDDSFLQANEIRMLILQMKMSFVNSNIS